MVTGNIFNELNSHSLDLGLIVQLTIVPLTIDKLSMPGSKREKRSCCGNSAALIVSKRQGNSPERKRALHLPRLVANFSYWNVCFVMVVVGCRTKCGRVEIVIEVG